MLSFLSSLFNRKSSEHKSLPRVEAIPSPKSQLLAKVSETVTPHDVGRIKFQGTAWRARAFSDNVFESGAIVQVLYRRGNVLIIDKALTEK